MFCAARAINMALLTECKSSVALAGGGRHVIEAT